MVDLPKVEQKTRLYLEDVATAREFCQFSFHCCQSACWWQYTIVAFLAWTPQEVCFCFLPSYVANWLSETSKCRRLPATSENSDCQCLGVLKIYFQAFHAIWWLTFAINALHTTSPLQLAWQTNPWCIQEATIIWEDQSKDIIVIQNINTIS